MHSNNGEVEVAIKVSVGKEEQEELGFLGRAVLWVLGVDASSALDVKGEAKALQELQHDNIVQLIAQGEFSTRQFGMVLEYADHGTLSSFVTTPTYAQMTWDGGRIPLALGIAQGLNYLHNTKKMLHRDIKGVNILIFPGPDGTYVAKLADFGGLEKIKPIAGNGVFGTLNWMAPECLATIIGKEEYAAGCSIRSDVWSYGLVLVQLATRKEPFRKLVLGKNGEARLFEHLRSGKRAFLPQQQTPPKIAELIRGCWQGNADERPDISHVVEVLESNGV